MWSVIASAIVVAGIAIAFVESKYSADVERARINYVGEQSKLDSETAHRVEDSLTQIFQGLRTIARLPGVQNIDRYGKAFSPDSRTTVQEIYNNLASNVDMSEVYIVPADMEPDEIDPVTKKKQEPITTFDHLIVGKTALGDEDKEHDDGLEEIEIFEYRLMKEQIRRLRERYPSSASIRGLDYPGILGREVITCDNRNVDPKHVDDKDRSGLGYSVPFFSQTGDFKGLISGVMLTRMLENLIGSPNLAIANADYNYLAWTRGGEAERHLAEIKTGTAAANLIYSQAIPLKIQDQSTGWQLWASRPDSAFNSLGVLRQATNFRWLAHIATLILTSLLVLVTIQYERRQSTLSDSNKELEGLVEKRTADLVNARKLEAIGQLASGVAHEINTPTQFISDNLRFLQSGSNKVVEWFEKLQKQSEGNPELADLLKEKSVVRFLSEAPSAIGESLEGTSRISEIVRAMRDYAHPSATPTTEANINSIIDNSVVIAHNTIKRFAEVKTELRESLPAAYCNPGEVSQVFLNLLINASHAIADTGRTDGLIVVRSWHKGDHIFASVTDNGSGIKPEVLPRIFDQFFTTKEVGTGTGMGLAIVRHVLEKHGGSIQVESEYGVGTTFTIQLPRTNGGAE